MIIREARREDLDRGLLELRVEFAKFESNFDNSVDFNQKALEGLRKGILDSFKNNDTVFLIAERDKAIVGYTSLHFYPDLPYVAYIGELFVVPSERHKGIGKNLLAKAFKCAKLKDIKEVKLRTYKDNSAAIGFFKKIGFGEEEIKTMLFSYKLHNSGGE